MAVKGAIVVDTDKCKGCGVCLDHCPTSVISLSKDVNLKGYHFLYMSSPDKCIGCSNCAVVCPDSVITVYRVSF